MHLALLRRAGRREPWERGWNVSSVQGGLKKEELEKELEEEQHPRVRTTSSGRIPNSVKLPNRFY